MGNLPPTDPNHKKNQHFVRKLTDYTHTDHYGAQANPDYSPVVARESGAGTTACIGIFLSIMETHYESEHNFARSRAPFHAIF